MKPKPIVFAPMPFSPDFDDIHQLASMENKLKAVVDTEYQITTHLVCLQLP